MGVYNPFAELPNSCVLCDSREKCDLHREYAGRAVGRHPNCPLVEVKEPHGDLIERVPTITRIQKIEEEPQYKHDGEDWINGLIQAEEVVRYAPTVIEAEG